MFERIITHDDFDGILCAAIAAKALGIDDFIFTGPRSINESRISVTRQDVVCDLPYPLECGLWFDHHQGNLEELRYRGVDPASIEGRFAPLPSCSRVVFDYFSGSQPLPDHFQSLVEEADIIDSFAYKSIEDWRKETPGKIIDAALRLKIKRLEERKVFMHRLVRTLQAESLVETAAQPEVREWYALFQKEETQMIATIQKEVSFLAHDKEHELIILDLTHHSKRPVLVKNLAYILFPEALGVIEVKNRFKNDVKTNDLSLSMSLSLNLNKDHQKDVGEIMRILNIGDGHAGAGSGTAACKSKDEMLRTKEQLLHRIFEIWRSQKNAGV